MLRITRRPNGLTSIFDNARLRKLRKPPPQSVLQDMRREELEDVRLGLKVKKSGIDQRRARLRRLLQGAVRRG